MQPDYVITGIWNSTTPHNHVSHVMLHEVYSKNADGSVNWYQGRKTDKDSVIRLIENKKVVFTEVWNYSNAGWNRGAEVSIVHLQSGKYLRTNRDKTAVDNLDNLIDLVAIV